jgi:anti-sigma-K factor RskA
MTVGPEDEIAAAEYALGTLPPGERALLAARRRLEPELDDAIRAWERRLSPLAEGAPAIEPPADYLASIQARIRALASASPPPTVSVAALQRKAARWRAAAIAASVVAALLAIGLGVREWGRQPRPRQYVAILEEGGGLGLPSAERERGIALGRRPAPEFLVTVDFDTMVLTARPIRAQAPLGTSYELWLVSPMLDGPRALGVIGETAKKVSLAGYGREVVEGAEYEVTVEPSGGSPNGEPSRPAAFGGKLIPAAP